MPNDNRQGKNMENPGIEGAPGEQIGSNTGRGMPGQSPGSQGAGAGDFDMGDSGTGAAPTVSGSVGSDVAEAGSDIGGGIGNSSMDAGGGVGAAVDTSRTGGVRGGKGTGGTGEGGTADDTITTDETGAHAFTPGKEDDDKLIE